jgi:S-formylglutathione hydrolase
VSWLTFSRHSIGGVSIEGDSDSWDFGTGAGFYVDATERKWSKHYRMYSYIVKELYNLVMGELPIVSIVCIVLFSD